MKPLKLHNIRFRLLDALDNMVARIHWLFSEERRNPYRCPICGGVDVHVRAWVRPNFGSRYVGDCEDFPEKECDWCETCEEKIHASTTDWFEREVTKWWGDT